MNTLPAAYLNVGDMLSRQGLLMTVDAVRGAEALWGGERAATKRAAEGGGVAMPKQLHAYGIILRPLITEKAQVADAA